MAAGAERLFLWAVLSVVLPNTQCLFQRQVTAQLNPGTDEPPPGGDLLHVRAAGDTDTLHYLLSSQGAPALLLVHTDSAHSTVQVNWTQFLAPNSSGGGLKVEPQSSVRWSRGLLLSRLLEYDDANDTAAPATSDLFPPYDLRLFTWSRLNLTSDTATAHFCGSAPNGTDGPAPNAALCLQLSVFGAEGRGQSWPRLLHSANSSQLEVWLEGAWPRAPRSRFFLELQAVGGASPLSRVEVRRSIDDEYTPAIFQTSLWVANASAAAAQGFVQWKPVAYRRREPALEDAAPCRHSDPRPLSGEGAADASALIRAFYSEPAAFGLNVSFGLAGDPFYNSTGFLRWTVLVGGGLPLVDSFSPLVVSIMAVALGTPLLLLLLGAVCVCARRSATPSATAYEPIN